MSDSPILFSICTLVTSQKMYESMKISFKEAGFTDQELEFLFIDNTKQNHHDAFNGLNRLADRATGTYLIFCHQDIELLKDSKDSLMQKLTKMNETSPKWAVLSNCGASTLLNYALCVLEGDGKDRNTDNFPMEVYSVDEHFFIVKNGLGLRFSEEEFNGFHLYGTDICLQSILNGFKNYAIEFKVKHYGSGNLNTEFYVTKNKLIKSYEGKINLGWIQTTCTRVFISSNRFLNRLMNMSQVSYLAKKYYQLFPSK